MVSARRGLLRLGGMIRPNFSRRGGAEPDVGRGAKDVRGACHRAEMVQHRRKVGGAALQGARSRELWSIVGALLFAAAVGIYGLVTADKAEEAARFLPLLAIGLVFLVMLGALNRQAESLDEVLERRLPATEYVTSRAALGAILQQSVQTAQQYVVAVGGRSRAGPYLETIERRVNAGEIAYWQLLLGGQDVTRDVKDHLQRLADMPRAHSVTIVDVGYAQMTVTESQIVIALPVPGHGGLLGLHVPDEDAARHLFAYLMEIAQSGT